MLLAVDIGNTNVVLGLLEGERVVRSARIETLRHEDATSAEARPRFYAEHFDTVEVDASYYAIPAERTTSNSAPRRRASSDCDTPLLASHSDSFMPDY